MTAAPGLGSATAAGTLPAVGSAPGSGAETGAGSAQAGPGPAAKSAGTTAHASLGRASAAQQVGVVDITTVLSNGVRAAATVMILTSSGEVLTNNHVVDGAVQISVLVVSTGQTYPASVLGYDPTQDVSVIQPTGASGLATVTTSAVPAGLGQQVVGVGNAGGVGGTPSAVTGRVRALDQSIVASEGGAGAEHLHGLIGMNTPIKPGDSGGPLYASNGKVVGMDTAGSLSGPTSTYAIPIATGLSVVTAIESGDASGATHVGGTAYLGVEISALTRRATVAAVVPGSPASSAGLRSGDVITALGSARVTSEATLAAAMEALSPGATVTVHWRVANGAVHGASVTLTSGPAK